MNPTSNFNASDPKSAPLKGRILPSVLILLISFVLSYPTDTLAQSMTGASGLFHVPTAVVQSDRTFIFGGAYIPTEYIPDDLLEFPPDLYDVVTGHGTIVFYPGLEMMFRYSGFWGMTKTDRDRTFMDRMFIIRYQIFKEKKRTPAFLIGIQDSGRRTLFHNNSYFAAQYVAASKHVQLGGTRIGLHLGYASDVFDVATVAFKGPFGGVNVMPFGDERLELILEHDSTHPNAAVRVLLLNRISLMAGLWNLQDLGVNGGIRFHL